MFEAGGAVFIMISNIHFSKLSACFKAISGSTGRLDVLIDRTSYTVFGGELGDQQRPTLERNDMKLGRFQGHPTRI